MFGSLLVSPIWLYVLTFPFISPWTLLNLGTTVTVTAFLILAEPSSLLPSMHNLISGAFFWLFLLAPTGALTVMMVYYISIQATFSDFHSGH